MKKLSLVVFVCALVFFSADLEPTFNLLDKGNELL